MKLFATSRRFQTCRFRRHCHFGPPAAIERDKVGRLGLAGSIVHRVVPSLLRPPGPEVDVTDKRTALLGIALTVSKRRGEVDFVPGSASEAGPLQAIW